MTKNKILIVGAGVVVLFVAILLLAKPGSKLAPPAKATGDVTIDFNLADQTNLKATLNKQDFTIDDLHGNYTLDANTSYTLEATKPGYKLFKTTFTLLPGSTTVIHAALERENPDNTKPQITAALTDGTPGINIDSIVYFYDNTWAFASINQDGNTAFIISRYDDGDHMWHTALGPGTTFDINNLGDLPPDVVSYLQNNNYTYTTQTQ